MKWPQHRDDPKFRATAPYSFPSGSIHNRKKFAAVPPPEPTSTPLPIPAEMWDQWEVDRDLKRGFRIAASLRPEDRCSIWSRRGR